MPNSNINSALASVNEVKTAIKAGKVLWLAGDEALLKQLPKGRWMGGSIPYFMGHEGGQTTRDYIYVAELDPTLASRIQIKCYNKQTIKNIAKDAPEDGFTILLIPALTDVHLDYARNAPGYEDMFIKPIAGWVTGIHLDDLGKANPIAINGGTGEVCTDKAVAMHVTLVPNKVANIGIVNIAKQSQESDLFEFQETGFSVKNCLINGIEQNLADYLIAHHVDTRFPLVADYSGAMINVSFQEIDKENRTVSFYAPLFSGIEYKLAASEQDYVSAFLNSLPDLDNVTFSCNCVLNYLHSELEGKKTADMTGPMTFGEIAYQLLNQTLVYLTIENV